MKNWALVVALAAAAAFELLAAPVSAIDIDVAGEYVEARSAVVPVVLQTVEKTGGTAGREAVLAWKMDSGRVDGVRVDGLVVVAVVAGSDDLAEAKSARRSVLYVDEKASAKQEAALVTMLRTKVSAALGTIVAVKRAPVLFETTNKTITVSAGEGTKLSVMAAGCSGGPCVKSSAPAASRPLSSGVCEARVVQGTASGCKESALGVAWTRGVSKNVFVGTFTF